MKPKAIFTLTVVCGILFSAMAYADDKTAPSATAPNAVVPSEKFEFQPVADGVEVVHDFVIQNKGTADLEILAVKPG